MSEKFSSSDREIIHHELEQEIKREKIEGYTEEMKMGKNCSRIERKEEKKITTWQQAYV